MDRMIPTGMNITLAALLLAGLTCARADDLELKLQIKDHKFQPAELTAPADHKLKIVVRNDGTGPSEFESVDLHREKVVPAGKEINVFVGPLKPGVFEFFDDFHPETRGHLTVK